MSTNTDAPQAGQRKGNDALAAYRAIHEREEALAGALAHDPAFIEGTRRMMELAQRSGTADWTTLEDLERAYGLHR